MGSKTLLSRFKDYSKLKIVDIDFDVLLNLEYFVSFLIRRATLDSCSEI